MKIPLFALLLLLFLSSCRQDLPVAEPGEGHVTLGNTKFYFAFSGSGDTLVVLHGGPGLSHRYLKPQLDSLLAPNFTLLYYDQRGSGWSDGDEDSLRLNMKTYIDDLEQLRRHFNITQLNLMGHSFGGLLGMYYGIHHPDRLNSLVLIDPDAASYELRTPYQVKMINSRLTQSQNHYLDSLESTGAFKTYDPETYETYYKTFLTSYFADPRDTAKLFLGFDSLSVPKISSTNRIVRKSLGEYNIHDQLPLIKSRTLIMQGMESVFSVEGAKAIHHKIPHAELHLFEACGHFEYIESPEKFRRLIEAFYGLE